MSKNNITETVGADQNVRAFELGSGDSIQKHDQPVEATMTFDKGDASELFFIIRSRGFSHTRSKLLEVLFQLDRVSAERINAEDSETLNA